MAEFKQDMPPPGGYAPIIYQRVPLKPGLNNYLKMAMLCGVIGLGWVGFHITKRKINNERIEMRCATLALTPMLQAEVDRMALKQLKRNRDAEEELMKDVKGWELGKWKNMPVYLTLDPNEYYKPAVVEYYAHAEKKDLYFVLNLMKNT